jgi:hypothetical protein
MAIAAVPSGTTNTISSWKPSCFRSKGMLAFSMVGVKAATLLGFNCKETVRANMSTSRVVVYEMRWQITRLSSGNLGNNWSHAFC